MNIPDLITNYAPNPHTVEKTLNILSALAPYPATVTKVLDAFARLAPEASSVWMLPLVALALSVLHALITRRAGMMVGAAFILCFYTAGQVLLPREEVGSEKQMMLLMTLHTWFSCVAAEMFFLCIALSLTGHFIAMAWRYYRTRQEPAPAPAIVQPRPIARKKAPVPKPLVKKNVPKAVPTASPGTMQAKTR